MNRTTHLALGTLMLLAPAAIAARGDVDMDARARDAAKSLVIVDFTLRNEDSSREGSGHGILLSKDVVLIAGSLISEAYPKQWITEVKVRLQANNFEPVQARLLGRTRNRLFAYLKAEKPLEGTPFVMGPAKPVKMGQQVFSVSISGSGGGYTTYTGRSDVRAILDLNHTLGNTSSFGLTRGTSPVFDLTSGDFVGVTLPSLGESMMLRDSGGTRRVEITDEEQSSVFLTADEVRAPLSDVPTEPFDLRRTWLAVDDLQGLQEDIRLLKEIKQPSGVVVGSVIAGESAEKAGLQAKDIILSVDGKEFSKNPVPEMMVMHFSRAIDERKPGDVVKLGVLREGKREEVAVTLASGPKISAEMEHVYSSKLGVVTRDLVFADTYQRRLPQDTKGVMVALVKQGAPAALGANPLRAGLLITKVDDQSVDNQKQFLEVLQKEEARPDLREMVFVVIESNGQTQVRRVDLSK